MAVEQDGIDISMNASGDLSLNQHRLLIVDANGRAALGAGSTVVGIGVLQNKPAAIDRGATVRVAGVTKCIGDAALNEQDLITSNAQGFGASTTTSGAAVWGQVLTATAGSAEVFSLLLQHFRY